MLNLTHADFCDYDYPETDVEPADHYRPGRRRCCTVTWNLAARAGEVVVPGGVRVGAARSVDLPARGRRAPGRDVIDIPGRRPVPEFGGWLSAQSGCHVGADVASACAQQPVRWRSATR